MKKIRLPGAVWLLVLLLLWLGCIGISLFLTGTGFIHPESYSFLPHYLSGRPFWELIFDNRITDWGNYQARELSFVVDWCDAQFIAWSVGHGHPHFFSASHYLLLLVGGLALWRIATTHLGLGKRTGIALVLLLWTTPTAMLYVTFYRSAKMGLLCATLLAVLAWFAAREETEQRRLWRLMVFGGSAVLLPMFDKQGLLFLLGGVAFLTRNLLVSKQPRDRGLLLAGLAALLVAWSYQRFIGPGITHRLLGYAVDRGYAAVPLAALVTQPAFLARVCGGAALLTLDSFRIPLGNLPAGLAVVGALWMWRQMVADSAPSESRWLSKANTFAGLVLLVFGVFAAMLMVFPLLLSSEHRRFFYPLPSAGLWLVALAAAVAAWVRRAPNWRPWLPCILGLLVVSNLYALQEHRFFLRNGKYQPFFANAARLQLALRPEHLFNSGVDPASAAILFATAPYFQDAVPPTLAQDRIFLLFLSRQAAAGADEATAARHP